MGKPKIIRITTVPQSLRTLLKGQHKFMSQNGFEVIGVSSNGEALEEVVQNEGIRVIPIEMSRKITPLKDLKSLWEMYRLFREEKPEIVHTHTPKAGIVGMLAAKLARVPHRLHTVAGLPLMEATGNKRKVLDVVEKLTYACASKVYPNSEGLREFILKEKFTLEEKLKIIANGSSNGIDTEFFSPKQISKKTEESLKESLNILQDDFVFVFVGRLVGDKGVNELIEAFKIVEKKAKKSIKLLFVGSEERELDPLKEQTINEMESNLNIILVGYQKDVRPYFTISNALAFPSYREGFPNVVLQAGSMGLPSVVSNINGCNEIIKSQENGLIIDVKNIDSLATSMLNLLKDKGLYTYLQNNSRKMIVNCYQQSVVWSALLEEYKELLKI